MVVKISQEMMVEKWSDGTKCGQCDVSDSWVII